MELPQLRLGLMAQRTCPEVPTYIIEVAWDRLAVEQGPLVQGMTRTETRARGRLMCFPPAPHAEYIPWDFSLFLRLGLDTVIECPRCTLVKALPAQRFPIDLEPHPRHPGDVLGTFVRVPVFVEFLTAYPDGGPLTYRWIESLMDLVQERMTGRRGGRPKKLIIEDLKRMLGEEVAEAKPAQFDAEGTFQF
jgi:hypothetical protein